MTSAPLAERAPGLGRVVATRPFLLLLAYASATAIVPFMLVEMLVLVPSLLSVSAALAAASLVFVMRPRIPLSGAYAMHLVAIACFLLLAVGRPDAGSPAVLRMDLINAVQALLVIPFLAALADLDPELGERLLPDTARVIVLVGASAALLGILKLISTAAGRPWEWLYLGDGRYPPGAALQQDYNQFALALVIACAFAIWLLGRGAGNRFARVALVAAIPVIIAAVVLSNSRRGVVFLAFILIVAGGRAVSIRASALIHTPLRRWVGGVVLVGLVALSAYRGREVLSSSAEAYLSLTATTSRLFELGDRERLTSSRAPLVADAVTQLRDEFDVADLLLGRGTRYLYEMGNAFSNGTGVEYPHNFVLSAMLHGGLVLTAQLLAIVGVGLAVAWRHRRRSWPLGAAMLLLLAFALSSSMSLYSHELLYLLLVGTTFGAPFFAGGAQPLLSRPTRPFQSHPPLRG